MTTTTTPGALSQSVGLSFTGITTISDLRTHLQWAVELEHTTVPPYLCALYSLDEDRNPDVAEVVRSVFLEEMLHILLAANLLNAVGGRPRIDTPQMLTPYPRSLPHADGSFEVSLLPFCPEALEIFLKIEQPPGPDAEPEGDYYETIGQFYNAIEQGLRELCTRLGEANVFCGDPQRQVSNAVFHGGGRRIMVVDSLATALAALDEIVVQGEGARGAEVWDGDRDMFHPERDEVGHYFRFLQLQLGRRYRRGDTAASGPTGDVISVDWDGARPMRRNPRTADHTLGSRIRTAQEAFNLAYCTTLDLLDQAFDGNPQMLPHAIGAMFRLKDQASALMRMPTEDGLATVGPTFEYVAPAARFQGMSQIRVRMTGRATDEPHRGSSHLELLFDLTFVVAISRITEQLGDRLAQGEGFEALMPFLQVFFLIWWAWMNFTWFASSYDTDDVAYRLLTLLHMAGVLVLAAGVQAAFDRNDFLVITVGYLIMRVGLIALWLRAAIEDSAHRRTALGYAAGIASLEVAWVLRLIFAEAGVLSPASLLLIFASLVVLELSLPLWSERKRRTWHPHHIAERYGLFAIILLGEGIFAASASVESATGGRGVSGGVVAIGGAGLVVIFALWWLYFLEPAGEGLARNRDRAFLWGCFGQYGIFAALAGLGAGLKVAIEQTGGHIRASPTAVGYTVAIPVGLFLVLVWAVSTIVGRSVIRPLVILGGAAVILLVPLSADVIGVAGVVSTIAAVCASMIAATILMGRAQDARRRTSDPQDVLVELQDSGPRRDADVVAMSRGG